MMIKRSLVALNILLSLSSFYLGKCLAQPRAPALYVFGDSLADSGNNNFLDVLFIAKANYKPYGADFSTGPTGRVTNGKIIPDIIADYLGLPYPARIMDPNASLSLTGYNYASAGCGVLPDTGPDNCMNLTEQVRLFEEKTKETVLKPAFQGEGELEQHLANSIFFIWVGNNDYLLNYFNSSSNSSFLTPEQFADLLTSKLSEKIQALHRLGARKMVVFEGPPFGCIPYYRYNNNGTCVEDKNENARLFNSKLKDMIQTLSSQLTNSYFTIGKAYDATYDVINNPTNYGFTNVKQACCLRIPPFVQCVQFGGKCANRDQYLFWDAAHPTEASNRIMGGNCITNSSVCTPNSIQDLVQLTLTPPSLLSAA
ncbi:GDSL esterase/lipase 7-like [Silene latifolia]|uniref:GDSL esterase/lipase 7-like n=1 Tax=Silene latifolia TaxID=37657 RepID=UPI003D7825B9